MRTLLAFLSGAVALVYQVVWTREVALLAGSQIQALSVVVAAYFGGLALGARWLGPSADRSRTPLRLYAGLEVLAAALAVVCLMRLRAAPVLGSGGALLAAVGFGVLLATLPLGGTLPALVRDAAASGAAATLRGGRLLAANTLGAMTGVALAIAAIPAVGLRATLFAAAAAGAGIGLLALLIARGAAPGAAAASEARVPRRVLLAAAAFGVAALGFEIVATRLAGLRLGSSLYAWGLVLAIFLGGLALGYAGAAPRAARCVAPRRELGALALATGVLLSLGLWLLRPELTRTAAGVSVAEALRIAAALLPTTCAMGAAFPYLVRLGVGNRVGANWGAVTAANTAGGICGALGASFVLLPALGPVAAAWSCGALSAAVGVGLLWRAGDASRALAAAGLALFLAAGAPLLAPPATARGQLLIAEFHDGQASVAVVSQRGHRTLIVDGDPEAATIGSARVTEELLAALPLLLHEDPRDFLEVGFGSGITLATALRFPIETAECVEIAPSVLRAASFFAPLNAAAVDAGNVRLHIRDARVFLAERTARYDAIAANTVHPWSLGATGLYSREYYERIAAALRRDGLAAQWLPLQRIGADALRLILRTFFASFEHGGVWWGANNLLLVGSRNALPETSAAEIDARLAAAGIPPHRLGLRDGNELLRRRIANAAAARRAVGPGPLLEDDRPVLETLTRRAAGGSPLTIVERLAAEGSAADPQVANTRLWLEAEAARATGDTERADGRERLAIAAGVAQAARARAARKVRAGYAALARSDDATAETVLREALSDDPVQRDARFGLAGVLLRTSRHAEAEIELEQLLRDHPDDPEAWNELANARSLLGDRAGARQAVAAALTANPFYPEALANAGLLALRDGEVAAARDYLAALERLPASPPRAALASELIREP